MLLITGIRFVIFISITPLLPLNSYTFDEHLGLNTWANFKVWRRNSKLRIAFKNALTLLPIKKTGYAYPLQTPSLSLLPVKKSADVTEISTNFTRSSIYNVLELHLHFTYLFIMRKMMRHIKVLNMPSTIAESNHTHTPIHSTVAWYFHIVRAHRSQ